MTDVMVAEVLRTDNGRTSTQVLTTDPTTAVGDVLVIVYGSDFFSFATMPDATSSAGVLTPMGSVDVGTNFGHMKAYRVTVTETGAKTVTIPNHTGCDIFGVVLRLPGGVLVDGDTASALDATATGPSHVAPSLVTAGPNRLLVCAWVAEGAGGWTGDPWTLPVSMTRQALPQSSPFSAMAVATETIAAAGATGTRTATYFRSARFGALSFALYITPPPDPEPEPEPEPLPTPSTGSGGWQSLISILKESGDSARDERTRIPAACPDCGQPLEPGPDNVRFCRFDGWQYPRDRN